MEIRTARLADLVDIVAIYNQAVREKATADTDPVTVEERRDWFERHAPDRRPILVAVRDAVVGWCGLSDYRPGRGAVRHTAEISYYVHAAHRRKGVASALVAEAIRRCPELEIRTLFAILLDSNAASVGLLEKSGFRRWGHMPDVADFDGLELGHLYYGLRVD
jgi:phosphinothricin acetyltransferase